ncbi:MAG: Transcriptional regulator, AsnC family [Thermoleophilia bacterium]|nr:Transcriptional regulator, AsnC family [Thermoleophilia bacterium]MCZ4497327.1 Transcriptional regulator, AsnC family [Thermoleophilia bacterium]
MDIDLPKFDAVDWHILEVLQHDARITNRELADKVGLSPSASLARMRSLRERGVIKGFAAELDLKQLGLPLQAIVAIRLHTHHRTMLDTFVRELVNLDETLDLFHVTGDADYLLHLAVRDPEHLRDVVLDQLTSRQEVAQVTTSLVFRHHRSAVVKTS